MNQYESSHEYSMLCLGDSYTIGESVAVNERFPEQTVQLLKEKKIVCREPLIIAGTGWTTQHLINAVKKRNITQTFDYVTLLIGVNDQFQGVDNNTYKKNFETLLNISLKYADGNADHVFVLSIPDYGVTPFAHHISDVPEEISKEIDVFNAVNLQLCEQYNVHYIDIAGISKRAENDNSLLADDELHPSGKMYTMWAVLLSAQIAGQIVK